MVDALFIPTRVTQFPAFGGGKACRERSGQQRNGNPERKFGGRTTGFVGRILCFRDGLVDPLFGLGLRKSGTGCDQACSVGTVVSDTSPPLRVAGPMILRSSARVAAWSAEGPEVRPSVCGPARSNRST